MNGRAADSATRRRPVSAAMAARRPPLTDDTGAVTVEAALALCALTVFVVLALGTLVTVAQSMRCADAARELARLAARGEPDRGRAVAARLAPSGAQLELVQNGDTLIAIVSMRPVGSLPLTVNGRAVAALETVGPS